MDSYKEIQVALYGDKYLNRRHGGVLAIDGPGQYEAPMIGLHFTMENWGGGDRPGRWSIGSRRGPSLT